MYVLKKVNYLKLYVKNQINQNLTKNKNLIKYKTKKTKMKTKLEKKNQINVFKPLILHFLLTVKCFGS